jgi:N-glycosylase/DNA lyase
VAEGDLDLATLRSASYNEAKAVLTALPGVGEKVADCVLAFSLDKMEGFPVDRWVRRALVEWYGLEEKAPYAELRAWAQARWGDSAAYVQQYLFHYRRLLG